MEGAHLNKLDSQWEPMQIKRFSRWANNILSERNLQCTDITKDLRDGVKLINLVELVTHKKNTKKWNPNPVNNFQMRENCNLALNILTNECKLRITNIHGPDIADGNVKLTLGLIWLLILNFSIEAEREEEGSSHDTATQALTKWCVKHTKDYDNVKDFKPTAYALCCLIHSFREDVINLEHIDPKNEAECARLALNACTQIGVPVYLDADDLCGQIEEKSLMTQLAAMKHALCVAPLSHKPFMLIVRVDGVKKAVRAEFGESYLNSAGVRMGIADPDPSDPAQLWTFGHQDGGWITVIDSVKQQGMVWDVANDSTEDPPEGTPFYLFPMHGRHNQRFHYRNKHIFACQNNHVVTYVGGSNPFVMKKLNPDGIPEQEFKLVYK